MARLMYHYEKKYSSIVHCRPCRETRLCGTSVMKYGYCSNDTMKRGERDALSYILSSLLSSRIVRLLSIDCCATIQVMRYGCEKQASYQLIGKHGFSPTRRLHHRAWTWRAQSPEAEGKEKWRFVAHCSRLPVDVPSEKKSPHRADTCA